VYENCEELESFQKSKEILHGQTVVPLDTEHKAQFTLKVLDTSERKFRLLFTIKCSINWHPHEETVLSHPFSVTSNKKRANIEIPLVFDIKPKEGLFSEETEVWIKGRHFTDRTIMSVTFGGKQARILETEENFICCYAPPVEHLTADTAVLVEVANFHHTKGKLVAEAHPLFSYRLNINKRISSKLRTNLAESQAPVMQHSLDMAFNHPSMKNKQSHLPSFNLPVVSPHSISLSSPAGNSHPISTHSMISNPPSAMPFATLPSIVSHPLSLPFQTPYHQTSAPVHTAPIVLPSLTAMNMSNLTQEDFLRMDL